MTMGGDLVTHLAGFAGALRRRWIAVGIGDEVDATRALLVVDLGDRDEVRLALRAALKVRRRDWEVFDEMYRRFWLDVPHEPATDRVNAQTRSQAWRAARAPGDLRLDHTVRDVPVPDAGEPGYSPEVMLRRKPFDECTAADFAAMERVLARLAPRLATRRSRRLVPARGGRVVDLRRSLRRAVSTGGDLVSLARRARKVEDAELLVLCDTSGSMGSHTRFLLAFVMMLRRVARRTEVFAFNTSLTRLTPWLSPGKIEQTLDRLAAGVPDWAGGTKIGESLADFVARYADELVTSRTVVLVFSDGLDCGDTTLVASAMRAIRARARRVIWLNPLGGDARYEPTARAMAAALPFVDRLVPAHTLEALERVIPELSV